MRGLSRANQTLFCGEEHAVTSSTISSQKPSKESTLSLPRITNEDEEEEEDAEGVNGGAKEDSEEEDHGDEEVFDLKQSLAELASKKRKATESTRDDNNDESTRDDNNDESKTLVTLSALPVSHWQPLLNLEAIKARNKYVQLSFLQSYRSLQNEFISYDVSFQTARATEET